MFAMFFVIMTSAPQLLNSVIEEKMSKISEVLLGSITPFELMMGKLLGNAGIAMVLAALYIGGGYAVAAYYGYADVVSPPLVAGAWRLFLLLAIMLYGSLYMAVGAACNELKDAQSLMMPVMLLSMFPIFVWMAVLKSPSSPLAVGLSLFPPASPFLMLMRMALRPAPPSWQVGLSIVLTHADVPLLRLGGRQDLPHRPADARQGPQLPRARAVGDGKITEEVGISERLAGTMYQKHVRRPVEWRVDRSEPISRVN